MEQSMTVPEATPSARDGNFSQVRQEYVILRWPFPVMRSFSQPLPEGYTFVSGTLAESHREDERRLLEENFDSWRRPFQGIIPGFRKDSGIYVLFGGKLVGGIYVCDVHEFEKNLHWGQLHYFFVDPQHRGKGLHRLLVGKAIDRATEWGLEGLYINTDRFGLPEVYQRWGATLWKSIPKSLGPTKHVDARPLNWLVHRIHEQAIWNSIWRYARGVLADIGCGKKPYAVMTKGLVERHVGVDYSDTLHTLKEVDVVADAYNTTLPDDFADTALSTTVLEHLERPQDAVNELFRILKPGGYLILSAPLYWPLHEEPRDFFRYTKHGMAHLLTSAGFEVVEIRPLSGFIVTFCAQLCYFLEALPFTVPGILLHALEHSIQHVGWQFHKRGWDKTEAFTWLYVAVGYKPSRGN